MPDRLSNPTGGTRPFPSIWHTPRPAPGLEVAEVQVWITCLDRSDLEMSAYLETLEAAERDRAFRFHFERDRRRFIIARGTLRALLGRNLGLHPAEIRFAYNSYGKPALSYHQTEQSIKFNVSHSSGRGLFALCRNRELGVDIERIRPDFGTEEVAEQFFSRYEMAAYRALPPERRVEAFFNCWTRKEAYIKARGEGLSFPLDQFDVAHAPGEPARLLCVRGEPNEELRWCMRDLAPGEGYKAALIVEGNGLRMRCFTWE